MLQYEPIKELYDAACQRYPELDDIAMDNEKKTLRPPVTMIQDLNTLEERMAEAFGSNSVHVAIQRPKAVDMRDSRFDDNKRSLL